MTRTQAKAKALKTVRGWGHFLPSMGVVDDRIVAYAPYIPFYQTDHVVGVDPAAPHSDRIGFLMAEIDHRLRYCVRYDPEIERLQQELQMLRDRRERMRPQRPHPDILCGRETAEMLETVFRRYAEADLKLSEFYGTFTIEGPQM